MDTDGSGSISIDEFCDAVVWISTLDRPVELLRILKQLDGMRAEIRKLSSGALQTTADTVDEELPSTGGTVAEEAPQVPDEWSTADAEDDFQDIVAAAEAINRVQADISE